jgi:fatty-acyl-CoA synthase
MDQATRLQMRDGVTLWSPPAQEPALAGWTRALQATAHLDATPARTLPILIAEVASAHRDLPALLGDGESFTFGQLVVRMNGVAHWARAQHMGKGDVVALLMENRPDYLAIWLGLTRCGIVVALINTSLTGASLAHCLDVAGASRVIVSARLAAAFETARPHLMSTPDVWSHGGESEKTRRFDLAIDSAAPAVVSPLSPPVTLADRALLIFTSGTTGLPKAAIVSHRRVLTWAVWFGAMLDTGPQDRMYDCLPLYHSVGGVVATGALLARGGSVVIAEKFSASRFWDDVRRWDCTLVQYIGELCRYLLAAPPRANDREHRLRIACGNGLREDVWTAFQQRFAVPRIIEFYAASEGTFSLYNLEGKPGAIGRVPPFIAHRFPVALVEFDADTQRPKRDAQGRCRRVSRNEVGEAIGRIADGDAAAGRFEGYTEAGESERKVLRDVFIEGDAWVRTGDLMRIDGKGFYYFVDRIGDTFRWKGENVSTLEVASALASCPGVLDIIVYGVSIPGADGRAGMAAIVAGPGFEPAALQSLALERLPSHARPLFLRLTPPFDLTGTFKHRPQELARDGFDPRRTADRLFVLESGTTWAPLDAAMFARIESGEIRF